VLSRLYKNNVEVCRKKIECGTGSYQSKTICPPDTVLEMLRIVNKLKARAEKNAIGLADSCVKNW